MRMIPSIVTRSTASNAERRIFDSLRAVELTPGTRAFHSLNLSEHDYKRVAELDFVILGPASLLVLEVKGGGVALREGLWHFTDRFGVEHRKSEGPFQQARSGMFSLETRLKGELGRSVVTRIVFGYGVVFPDCSFDETAVEWAPEMVMDERALRRKGGLKECLSRLQGYWATKVAPTAGLTSELLDAVARELRPDFERVPSLRHRAEELDVGMERLTAEQYTRLDLIEENPRILCGGGAGTGKTFLAAEIARRHAVKGDRVLFVTSGALLAAFVKSRLPDDRVIVRAADNLGAVSPVDVLVVDEGQDLVNFENLQLLDGFLRGGLSEGRWRIFFDANKQTGLRGRYDPEAMELLKSYGAVSAVLRYNCRNTRQITTQTTLLTGADVGTPTAGDGPKVHIVYFVDEKEQAELLDEELARLAGQEVVKGDITVLSPLSIEHSCVRLTKAYMKRHIRPLDKNSARTWPSNDTTFSTVADFKGLENRFILLVDVASLDSSQYDQNILYVALSRARAGLWIAVDKRLRGRLDQITRANMERLRAAPPDVSRAFEGAK